MKVDDGDIVVFYLQDTSCGQITPSSTDKDLSRLDLDKLYPLGGPIYKSSEKRNKVEIIQLKKRKI